MATMSLTCEDKSEIRNPKSETSSKTICSRNHEWTPMHTNGEPEVHYTTNAHQCELASLLDLSVSPIFSVGGWLRIPTGFKSISPGLRGTSYPGMQTNN